MGITFGDHLIDSGHYDITPEQEREIEAREECERHGIDPVVRARSMTCATCRDHGEIGWYDSQEGAYRNEPCPDCYQPGDCDGSCTHPKPRPLYEGGEQ